MMDEIGFGPNQLVLFVFISGNTHKAENEEFCRAILNPIQGTQSELAGLTARTSVRRLILICL